MTSSVIDTSVSQALSIPVLDKGKGNGIKPRDSADMARARSEIDDNLRLKTSSFDWTGYAALPTLPFVTASVTAIDRQACRSFCTGVNKHPLKTKEPHDMVTLKPKPDNGARHDEAHRRRGRASDIANHRKPQKSVNNGEIDRFDSQPTSFHKGLPHNEFGVPDAKSFLQFVSALNHDAHVDGEHAAFDVALGPEQASGANRGDRQTDFALQQFHTVTMPGDTSDSVPKVRNWESPLAGHSHDLEGPDAGDLAMAPAPTLAGDELAAEMAEVYALALIRDVPFSRWEKSRTQSRNFSLVKHDGKLVIESSKTGISMARLIEELNRLNWFNRDAGFTGSYEELGLETPTALELRRHKARFGDGASRLTAENMFRGSSPGCHNGPYISQFLLIGSPSQGEIAKHYGKSPTSYTKKVQRGRGVKRGPDMMSDAKDPHLIAPCVFPVGVTKSRKSRSTSQADPMVASGYIVYGAQRIDQRVNSHLTGRDHLTDWPLWLDVQNGANVAGTDAFMPDQRPRFVATPRDLGTYVHFDQLYQAYFNACLLMFSHKVAFDTGFPSGSTHSTRGSFATFGGPHILSLMTEVASRALKAVRRQKFQQHLRCRPEQLAAMLTLAANGKAEVALGSAAADAREFHDRMQEQVPELFNWIAEHNKHQNHERASAEPAIYPRRAESNIEDDGRTVAMPWNDRQQFTPSADCNYLLPMAFPEGSPMHASYGAGHATVAGACTTMLKAYFELSTGPVGTGKAPGLDQSLTVKQIKAQDDTWWNPASMGADGLQLDCIYEAPSTVAHDMLEPTDVAPEDLSIEGELNKLAANIAIGRDMAGVHFYTDYFDSLRMGERLAVGILEEQMCTYSDPVSMRLTSFDGDYLIVHGDGKGNAHIDIKGRNHSTWAESDHEKKERLDEWWNRHVHEFKDAGNGVPSTGEPAEEHA